MFLTTVAYCILAIPVLASSEDVGVRRVRKASQQSASFVVNGQGRVADKDAFVRHQKHLRAGGDLDGALESNDVIRSEQKPVVGGLFEAASQQIGQVRRGAPSSYNATGLHILLITDCTVQQKWIAHMFFSTARDVGQDDPITWVRTQCQHSEEAKAHDLAILQALHPKAEVVYLETSGRLPDQTWIKPAGMQVFLNSEPSLPKDTVIALCDADMIFLTRFRVHDLANRGIPGHTRGIPGQIDYGNFTQERTTSGSFVGGLIGVAQHYQCCDGLGPPYILSGEGWRLLNPRWENARLATKEYKGWGSDQVGFASAATGAGIKLNIFDHFMVSDIDEDASGEGTPWVQEALKGGQGNVCASGLVGDASIGKGTFNMPTFLHIVRPWAVKRSGWYFSKAELPRGGEDGILECAMPLMAVPPTDLMQTAKNDMEQLNAWGVCTIIHSLNSMLRKVKAVKCGAEINNLAPALKFDEYWQHHLLPGGTDRLPASRGEWVRRCIEIGDCEDGTGDASMGQPPSVSP